MAASGKIIPFKKTRRSVELPLKIVRFCEHVFEHQNRTQAYIDCIAISKDISRDIAKGEAWKIMQQPRVRKYIRELQRHAFSASRATVTRIVSLLASASFADRSKLLNKNGSVKNPTRLPWDVRATLEGIEVEEVYGTEKDPDTGERIRVVKSRKFKLRTSGRIAAAELLMKMKGMLKDESTEAKDLSDGPMQVILEGDDPADRPKQEPK
jgi:Terminase small subunit